MVAKYFLVQLLPRWRASIPPGSNRSGQENRGQDERTLHSEDDAAIRFLLGCFISIDIISVLQLGRVLSWN
jgi:hypothetical protein